MTDRYRIQGKIDSEAIEPLYLLEVEISRKLLVNKNDMNNIFAMLQDGQGDGDSGWSEAIETIRSGFYDSIQMDDVPNIQTPWTSANFSNKNLNGLILALESQDEEFAIHQSGSPQSGAITFTAIIGGRQYSRTVRSSSEAKVFAASLNEFQEQVKAAGWGIKSIKMIASTADWLLRAAGIYEIAEKAAADLDKWLKEQRQIQNFERELRANIERSRSEGINKARELDLAERMSKTA